MNPLTPRKVRWGLLGCGAVSAGHVAALHNSPESEIVGVADMNAALAQQLADQLGIPAFHSVEALLASTHPEAVTIALPNFLHEQAMIQAAESGAHVLCEKPLGRTSAECERMVALCHDNGVQLGSILNYRGYRQLRWIHQRIHTGNLHPLSISFDVALPTPTPGTWRGDQLLSGGGILLNVGIHYLDLLLWWLGEPVEATAAVDRSDGPENLATAILRFRGGVIAVCRFARIGLRGLPVRMEIEAKEGRLRMVGTHIETCDPELGEFPDPEPVDERFLYGIGHLVVVREAAHALANNEPLPINGREGSRAVALCEWLYRAAQERCWHQWHASS